MTLVLVMLVLQTQAAALDNDYVRVTRAGAPCASAAAGCGERIIVALGDVELRSGDRPRRLRRGEIAVFARGESYAVAAGGPYFEVNIKPGHPPADGPAEVLPPDKNTILHDGQRFFVFEERLAVGDTRARHSHGQRVVIQLNRTRLQQWPEGQDEMIRDIEPDRAGFNLPVIHIVKNVGDLALRGIVIEFRKAPRTSMNESMIRASDAATTARGGA